jgi:hypothetical protein
MDDAIDLANKFVSSTFQNQKPNSRRSGRLLAIYVFTSPASAKYLGQFINASAVYVNQIPTQLLCKPLTENPETTRLDSD